MTDKQQKKIDKFYLTIGVNVTFDFVPEEFKTNNIFLGFYLGQQQHTYEKLI